MSSANRDALIRVARLLGPLVDTFVFVGGRVAELLVTEPGHTRVRPTDDSDAICEIATRTEYYRLGERLRRAGFAEDTRPGAPICRWCGAGETLDVMPVDGDVLGFRNAWYGHAMRGAVRMELTGDVAIRVARAPVFLATKWDAFSDRGAGDWYGSHDIEDIISVVAGRLALVEELRRTEEDVRAFVATQTSRLLDSGVADDVVAGALPDVRHIPELLPQVIRRLAEIGQLM